MCPNCGRWLELPLSNGITTCINCNKVFDSSPYNKLLSASWEARKNHLPYSDVLQEIYQLSDEDTKLLQHYVIDNGYCHDEFVKIVKNSI